MVAGQGVEIGVNFFLENEAEIARIIAASGGKLGKDFSDKLSVEGKKAFDELVASADKAAKDVGARFSKTDLRFKNNLGQFLTQQELEKLSKTNQAFKDAVEGVNKFRSAVESAAKSTERNFNLIEAAVEGVAISLTSRLTDAVTVALGGVKGLIGGFLNLDGELRLAAAAAGETGAYEKLGAIVDKVGIEAAGTTKQVAELATSLIRAGFSVKEIETALPGVVRGAEATGTSFASFGDIVGNTLRGFQLDVEKTGHVVDVLVNTANSSNASIEGLGYTFEYTAPIAKALGISLEEVAAAAGLMANAGIQGSVAGTGLRTGLQKIQQAAGGASPEVMGLARGQERLTGVMRKLGAQVVDTNGKLLPLDKVFLSLKSGLEKLNQADQVQLANVLFGDEAGSKFLAILNQSDVAITKMFRDMANSSGAADTARTAMSGMGLELQQLTGTLQSLGTQLGSVVAAGLRPFVGIANSAASIVSGLPGPVKTAAGALIALTAASTAATIAMMATNVVIKQIGFTSLAAGASAAAKSILSMGSGMIVILGIASAAAILSGNFRETDRTTKQVLQTTIALGAGILVLRNMSIILSTLHAGWLAWNTAIRTSGALLAFVQALSGKGLATIAVAATAAAATYVTLGNMIKVNGEETEGLTTRASELKDEIKSVQDEIDKTKKLKLDTTEAQRKLDTLQSQLQQIETPLELKIDIQKVEQQIKGLEAALGKLSQDAPQRGPIEAELSARRAFLDVLKAADEGAGTDRVKEMSKASKEIVRDTTAFRNEIDRLTKQKIGLSSTDTEKRNTIDRRIAELQSNLSRRSEREQLEMINKELQRKLQLTKQEIIETEKASKVGSTGVTPFLGIVNPNADQPVVKSQEDYSGKIKSLKREEQLFTQKILDNQLQIEQSARSEERTARGMVVTAKEKLELAKSKLEVEQMAKGNIEKQASLESNRLRTIRDIADAYSGLASAQAALVQSRFDVDKSRNSREISEAESVLQRLIDSKARAEDIYAVEAKIAQLKRNGEDLEYEAMSAAIEATQKRFDIENAIFELKQKSQLLEQQSAIRSADQNVLQQQGKLLELKGKLADPSMLPEQKASVAEQVRLQQQSVDLSKQQAKSERQKLDQLGIILALDQETQAAQQETVVNQQRALAASKGFEYGLSEALDKLRGHVFQQKEGSKLWAKIKDGVKDVNKALEGQGDILDKLLKKTGRLGGTGQIGNNSQPASNASSGTAGSDKSDFKPPPGMGWREIKNMGIERFAVAGMPKHVEEAMIRRMVNGGRVWERVLADGTIERNEKSYLEFKIPDPKLSLKERNKRETQFWRDQGYTGNVSRNISNKDDMIVEKWLEQNVYEKKIIRVKNEGLIEVTKYVNDLKRSAEAPIDLTTWDNYRKKLQGILDDSKLLEQQQNNTSKPLDESMKNLDTLNSQQSLSNVNSETEKTKTSAEGLKKAFDSLNETQPISEQQKSAIMTTAEALQKAYDMLKQSQIKPDAQQQDSDKLMKETKDATENTQKLKEEWKGTAEQIEAAAKAAANVSTAASQAAGASLARWAGGGVEPGLSYQINELGQESWLDQLGRLRLLTAPPYARWTPPSRGLVLPANVTAALKRQGAFDRPSPAVVSGATRGNDSARPDTSALSRVVSRLERGLASLEGTMRSWRPMDVTVHTPSSAGQIQMARGIIG